MSTEDLTRDERALIALEHLRMIEGKYANEIKHSIEKTIMYDEYDKFEIPSKPKYPTTKVRLRNLTTEETLDLFDLGTRKTAILNFSDYVRCGGQFLQGSAAQEEALCHSSILYPVLENFKYSFYARNKQEGLLNGMYKDRMLYSEDVLFNLKSKDIKVDVITCAAPNFITGKRYGTVNKEHCDNVMRQRLEYIFRCAISKDVNVLFLGAYGCGVFRNDPEVVANTIKELCEKYEGYIEYVVLPVPRGGRNPQNWSSFANTFFGYRMSDL